VIGPVQVLVVGFDQPTFSGEVLAELTRLQQAGIVRLLDLLLVARAEDGTLDTVTNQNLPAGFGGLAAMVLGSSQDVTEVVDEPAEDEASWSLADVVPVGQTAAVALLEHTWASPLRDAILRNGGRALDETWLAPADLELVQDLLAARDGPPRDA
jgi:hypothetical protein